MPRVDPERSQVFNTTLIISAVIAAVLALCIIWILYGCARQTTNKPKFSGPGTTGAVVLQFPRR
jgi:hypothetical protein